MPAPINEITKRRVVQQWLCGESRTKIAIDNNIGEGTVSSIVSEFKIGLDNAEFDSARELALVAKKQGLNLSELSSNFRLHYFIRKSGAAEDKIESFITNVNSGYIPLGKAIELINQIYEISKSESVAPDQLPDYVKQKLEEKQKIDEQIKEADAILQTKNVKIKTINEHVELSERLNKHGLSTQDINKLVKLVVNAQRYGFDAKKFVGKLSNIKLLERREKGLRGNCAILSKKEAMYKEVIPLAQLIWDLQISEKELISFKIAVNEVAETYGLTPSSAALDVINLIKDHNKKGQLEHELSELSLQIYAVNEMFSNRIQVIMALTNLKNHGITEDNILYLNNILGNNGYNVETKSIPSY
jgi:hypothetical protein